MGHGGGFPGLLCASLFIFPAGGNLAAVFRVFDADQDGLAADVAVLHVFHRLVGGLRLDVENLTAVGTGKGKGFVQGCLGIRLIYNTTSKPEKRGGRWIRTLEPPWAWAFRKDSDSVHWMNASRLSQVEWEI